MSLFLALLCLAAGSVFLYYGAEYLVRGSVALARLAGISQLVIGLTFVAFGTSAPELMVSLDSALRGQADISLGNVIGSNICNIGLILGLCAILAPMPCSRNLIRFDAPFMLFSCLLFSCFYAVSHGIGRLTGALFFLLLCAYLWFCIRRDRKAASAGEEEKKVSEEDPGSRSPSSSAGFLSRHPLIFSLCLAVGGLAGLAFGANLFVRGAVDIARMLHVPEAVIGLTLVAVGTSLPELATSLIASWKGENDIAVGNVVGSNIFNIFAILGITPMIQPVHGTDISAVDFGVMLALAAFLMLFAATGKRVNRAEGAVLFLTYAGYIAWLICSL